MEKKQRVLVVDDEAAIREMLAEYLDSHGFEVMAADSGKTMRELLAKNVPDVVLLDVNLPGEDGLTLARIRTRAFRSPHHHGDRPRRGRGPRGRSRGRR